VRQRALVQADRHPLSQHYHKRSLSETTFMMIKAKFGAAIRSWGETAQVNELLYKVRCHNLCVLIQSMFELGIEPNIRAETASAQVFARNP
jgi:transposase